MENPTRIVVAIGRQIASGGAELGERLAKRLGFAYIDSQIVQQAAQQLGVNEADLRARNERVIGFWERIAGVLSLGIPESGFADFRRIPEVADAALFGVEAQVIHDLAAARDSVLIGHAGFHCLRHLPGIVRVFVHADREFRVARMASRYNITDPADARAMIDRTDKEREEFIRRMAGVAWTDARNYDLCINMSRVGMELAEELVLRQIEQQKKAM
jgi:cytidylate kinase